MAKYKSLVKLSGRIGDAVFYDYRDIQVARMVGNLTKERVQRDPAFERSRESSREFGGASIAGAMIRHGMGPVLKRCPDGRLAASLTKLCQQVQDSLGRHPSSFAGRVVRGDTDFMDLHGEGHPSSFAGKEVSRHGGDTNCTNLHEVGPDQLRCPGQGGDTPKGQADFTDFHGEGPDQLRCPGQGGDTDFTDFHGEGPDQLRCPGQKIDTNYTNLHEGGWCVVEEDEVIEERQLVRGYRPVPLSRMAGLLEGLRSPGSCMVADGDRVIHPGPVPGKATHVRAWVQFFTLSDVVYDADLRQYVPLVPQRKMTIRGSLTALREGSEVCVVPHLSRIFPREMQGSGTPKGPGGGQFGRNEVVMCAVMVEFVEVKGGFEFVVGREWIVTEGENSSPKGPGSSGTGLEYEEDNYSSSIEFWERNGERETVMDVNLRE